MVSISELDPKSKKKNLSCKPSITLVSKCLTYLIAQILYTQEVYSEIYFYHCNNLQLSGRQRDLQLYPLMTIVKS